MALKKTAEGKVDKRTKEYKEMVERMAKARKAAAKKAAKPAAKPAAKKPAAKAAVKRTASGAVDKRTKEGREIAERMAKARAAKNSFSNRLKRLFK